MATLLGLTNVAQPESDLYTIEYNMNSVVGVGTNEILNDYSWENHVGFVDGRYRRLAGINDNIWIPGNSVVDVLAIVKNETGHGVTLRDWMFFTTRENSVMADLGSLGIVGTSGSVSYKFMGFNAMKYGKFIHSPEVLNLDVGETKTVKTHTLNIVQPLQVENFVWTPSIREDGSLIVNFELKLKNITGVTVRNIEFVHGNYYLKRNFPAFGEYTYLYQVNYGANYSSGLNLLDSFEIRINTTRTECLVAGSSLFDYYHGDTKIMAYDRSDEVGGVQWFGQSVDLDWYPDGQSMCITLMPYRLLGTKLHYYTPVSVDLDFVGVGGILGINDVANVQILLENKGNDLDYFEFELKADLQNQEVKNSSCNVVVLEDGVLFKVFGFQSQEERICNITFEILNKESFLNLEYGLVVGENISKNIVFNYIPDVEISLSYHLMNNQFVFFSNVHDMSSLIAEQSYERGVLCKKVQFVNLQDEVCL